MGIACTYHSSHILFEYKLVLEILKLGPKLSLVFYMTREHSASLAVIVRDHKGVVINIWARIIEYSTPPPLQAEAEALLWAVEIAKKSVGATLSSRVMQSAVLTP